MEDIAQIELFEYVGLLYKSFSLWETSLPCLYTAPFFQLLQIRSSNQ